NPSKAKVDINYRGNRQILIVQDPAAGQIIPEDYKPYLWYSIGLLGLVLVLMLLINIFSRRKSKSKTDESYDDSANEEAADSKNQPVEASTEATKKQAELTKEEKKPIPTGKSAPMILLSKDGRTQTFPLIKEITTLGRHESNDIVLPELTVTGKHALINYKDNEISIEDLGSTNGTFVNGERIRSRPLKPGDKITLGKVELTLKE
ncbi:MAG: FHA domain-containing protein, partial [Bacteroidia bacterium]